MKELKEAGTYGCTTPLYYSPGSSLLLAVGGASVYLLYSPEAESLLGRILVSATLDTFCVPPPTRPLFQFLKANVLGSLSSTRKIIVTKVYLTKLKLVTCKAN